MGKMAEVQQSLNFFFVCFYKYMGLKYLKGKIKRLLILGKLSSSALAPKETFVENYGEYAY